MTFMKRFFRYAILILALSAVEHVSAQEWAGTLAEARTRSTSTGKPLFLVVSAGSWCDPCVWLEQNTLTDAALQDLLRASFIPVLVHDGQLQAQSVDYDRVPSVMVFRAGSEDPVFVSSGPVSAQTLVSRLMAIAAERSGTEPAEGIQPGNQLDIREAEYTLNQGRIFFQRGRWRSVDAGLPPEFELYEEDEEYLYLKNEDAQILLALPRTGGEVWRWSSTDGDWFVFTEAELARE